jgi:hypothetical protein
LTWKLQHLHLVLALILLSHTTCHVGDFDIEIFKYPVLCFAITPNMTFRRRDIGSLKHVTGGPAWILADNKAPYTRDLGSGFEDVPYAKCVEDERTNRFHHGGLQIGSPTELSFRISIYAVKLPFLGGSIVGFIDSNGDHVLGNANRCKVIFLGHGVVLPVNKAPPKKFTNATQLEGKLVDEVDVLCHWFELKPDYKGDALFDGLMNPEILGKNAKEWVDSNWFDLKVKLLLE